MRSPILWQSEHYLSPSGKPLITIIMVPEKDSMRCSGRIKVLDGLDFDSPVKEFGVRCHTIECHWWQQWAVPHEDSMYSFKGRCTWRPSEDGRVPFCSCILVDYEALPRTPVYILVVLQLFSKDRWCTRCRGLDVHRLWPSPASKAKPSSEPMAHSTKNSMCRVFMVEAPFCPVVIFSSFPFYSRSISLGLALEDTGQRPRPWTSNQHTRSSNSDRITLFHTQAAYLSSWDGNPTLTG